MINLLSVIQFGNITTFEWIWYLHLVYLYSFLCNILFINCKVNSILSSRSQIYTHYIILDAYDKTKDNDLIENNEDVEKLEARDPKFSKGQSKRIWNELYKVSFF